MWKKTTIKKLEIWKEWFTIQSLDFTFTERMDQAFRSTHGIGYVDYQNNAELRMRVEMNRDRDYELGQQVVARLERQVHRDL